METIINFIKEWYLLSVLCGGASLVITMLAGWALVKSLSMVTDSDEETEDEE
tara:strand:- start:26 stop:181 length:156 start_codon:yes stop_codon:yes gene_type:complete